MHDLINIICVASDTQVPDVYLMDFGCLYQLRFMFARISKQIKIKLKGFYDMRLGEAAK